MGRVEHGVGRFHQQRGRLLGAISGQVSALPCAPAQPLQLCVANPVFYINMFLLKDSPSRAAAPCRLHRPQNVTRTGSQNKNVSFTSLGFVFLSIYFFFLDKQSTS